MRKALVSVAIVLATLTGTSAASDTSTERQVHQGATGLMWLTNPAHARFGTAKARARAHSKAHRKLMGGLSRAGFLAGALCVHGYEGSWQDAGSPYYGGMQMDLGFQGTYGPEYLARWGTADRWPVWAQLNAAYRGWKARGWWPWPNTARYCGLL